MYAATSDARRMVNGALASAASTEAPICRKKLLAAAAVPAMARKTHSAPRPLTAASPPPSITRPLCGAPPAPPARPPPPSATAETTQRGSSHCNEMTIFRTRGEHFAVKWPRYTKKAQVGFIAIPQIRPRNSDNRYFVPKRLLFERANRRRARLRCDRLNPRRASPSFAPALPSAPGLSFIFLEKFRGMRGVVA